MRTLNVQIENLCQFLPQDKVVSFAKLSPEDLLVETERAISTSAEGDASLYDKHQKLIQFHTESQTLSNRIQTHKQKLDFLNHQKAEIERDVEKIKKKQKLEEDREWAEKKLKWCVYNRAKDKYVESKNALAAAKETHAKKEKVVKAKQRDLRKEEKEEEKWRDEATRAVKALGKAKQQMQASKERVETSFQEVEDIENRIHSWQEDKKNHEQELAQATHDLQQLASELEIWQDREKAGQSGFQPQHQRRLDEVKQMIANVHVEQTQCRKKIAEMRHHAGKIRPQIDAIDRRLSSFTDSKRQRIDAMCRASRGNLSSRNIYRAMEWIERNRQHFRGRIYGPVVAEIQSRNDQHAVYLENQVPAYVWESFLTTYSEDRALLERELVGNQDVNINILSSRDGEGGHLTHPHGEARQYQNLDVHFTLDETFDAPPAVKSILKDIAGIHMAYVGTHFTQDQIDQASRSGQTPQWRQTKISNLWTPETRYMKIASRYDRYTSLRTTNVRPSRILLAGSGQSDDQSSERSRLDREKAQLKSALGNLEAQIEALSAKQADLDESIQVLEEEKQQLLSLKNKVAKRIKAIKGALAAKTRHLKKLERTPFTQDQQDALKGERAQSIRDQAAGVVKCVDLYASYADKHFASVPVHMRNETAREKIMTLRHAMRFEVEESNRAALQVDRIQTIFDLDKEAVRVKKKEAEEAQPLTEESKQRFADLPTEYDDLEEVLIGLNSQISSLMINDPNVLQEHGDLVTKIAELEKKVASEVQDSTNYEANLKKQESAWLKPLADVVNKVNRKFTQLFADLGFVGEVRLRASEEGYQKYRLELYTKFHDGDEELQILDAKVQSGGERSVSTILFLIALQQLTPAPFRVIDEINQGMDPTNERRVFKQLVQEACTPGSPQCFLLTPKLLPSLHYSDEVTVLNIFNGPFTYNDTFKLV